METSEIEETQAKALTRNDKFRKIVIQNSDNVSVAPKHSIVRKINQRV